MSCRNVMGATTSRTGPKDNTRISNSVSSSWSYRSVIRYSRSSSFCVSFSKWEKCNRTRSKPLRSSWRSSVSALRRPFGTFTAPGSYSSSSSQERIRAMLIVFILRIPVTKIRNLSSFSEYSKRYGLQTKEWRTPVCPWNRIRIFRFSWIARNTMRKQ